MLEGFQRYPLTFGPTPIEKLSRLTMHLGGEVQLYAKREDCNSGLAFGGNKIRKLEYIVPDILASNADTIVTIGGVQSNHTRQVAAVAAKLGLKCRLVQESWVPFEDAVYDRVGNILMSRVMGADIDLVDEGFDIGIRESWQRAIEDVKGKGGKPYPIPAGASVHKYGGLGFVGFAEEVRAQEAQLGFRFDYIVVCSVTGSTPVCAFTSTMADSTGSSLSELSKTRETSHSVAGFFEDPPLKNRWVRRSARKAFELVGPRTNRMASEMFDLPIPFGPATPVNPGWNGISVAPANDLKFLSLIRFRCIGRFLRSLDLLPPTPEHARLSDACQQRFPSRVRHINTCCCSGTVRS